MTEPKYKLIRAGKMPCYEPSLTACKYFRLVALRDIPEHGVKAGDLGGYVTSKNILDHEGSCWIGGIAQVRGQVKVSGNAYIGDKAVVSCEYRDSRIQVSDNARIIDSALIYVRRSYQKVFIKDNAVVSGNARLRNALEVSGQSLISGNALLDQGVKVLGNSTITHEVNVGEDCILSDTTLTGLEVIPKNLRLRNGVKEQSDYSDYDAENLLKEKDVQIQSLQVQIMDQQEAEYLNKARSEESSQVSPVAPVPVEQVEPLQEALNYNENLAVFNEIKGNIASYETDIVKIIKYPSMVDPSVPETLEMTVALKKATRLSSKPESSEFVSALDDLEKKFILAQSNAFKLVSTMLSDADKKKAERAKDLFRIASNEASSENEKKTAFIQGFKQLEGVLPVPEVAIDAFRIKIGLKELEA